MSYPQTFLPRIPQPVTPLPPVSPPFALPKAAGVPVLGKEETLVSWVLDSFKAGIKSLPKIARQLAIQLGIVLAVNFILWPLDTWVLPGPLANLASIAVFLTATYNNIIPKTIYWVIVFTFGKRLFGKIRREGFARAIQPMRQIGPEFNKAKAALADKAYSLLLLGGGAGLIIANNFASYSRFSGARNKMDKYFVALVISFTVSYILGENQKGPLFKFARLAQQDLSRLFRRTPVAVDAHTYVALTGFVLGLLLDAPLILLKMMYGGYILGAVCLAGAAVLPFINARRGTYNADLR